MREMSLPPLAASLMESMRSVGYSLESALADLIDNSISANAGQVEIQFRPFDDPYIAILDDGRGMSPAELDIAMQYGSRSPLDARDEKDLGRYGLGLKTASLSQCRRLTVITARDGVLSARCWDMDVVAERAAWIVLIPEGAELKKLPHVDELQQRNHGTIVLWQKLDRLLAGESSVEDALGQKIDHARSHLAKVFHRYISGERGLRRLAISINQNQLPAFDPFLLDYAATQHLDEESFLVEGRKVVVKPFILPHISKLAPTELELAGGEHDLRSQQGFYVYRNRRLIIWGTWFRLARKDELSKLARVRVDIPNSLDHLWTLDIKKSVAHPPEIVRFNLRRTVARIADRSRQTYTFRGRQADYGAMTYGWSRIQGREGIRYDINRSHPAVVALVALLDSEERRLLNVLLEILETSFPTDSLYADMASDIKVEKKSEELKTQLREMAETIASSLKPNSPAYGSLLSALHLIEPFSRYPDLAQEISKELTDANR